MNERLRRLQYENAKLQSRTLAQMSDSDEITTTAPSPGMIDPQQSAARIAMINHMPLNKP